VFFADKMNTPMLIQFGDVDDAVPYSQGVELYLALRRFQKPAIMLQYEGEPHHLKKFANKLDYLIKMKEFADYHVGKLEEKPDWMDGVPYWRGK
jgi:dipeptidyl aminopeptidase/acylaminoacyl peptidase